MKIASGAKILTFCDDGRKHSTTFQQSVGENTLSFFFGVALCVAKK
jgi:hypothetical protein